MIVKAIYKDKNFDYFTDKENGLERHYGDIFECDDEIAQERIKNKFVKKATKEEERSYVHSIDTNDEETVDYTKMADEKLLSLALSKGIRIEPDKFDRQEIIDILNNPIKPLEECTMEELIQIAQNENIELSYPKDDTAQDVIIEIINKVRAERLEQNGGEE